MLSHTKNAVCINQSEKLIVAERLLGKVRNGKKNTKTNKKTTVKS